MWLQAFDGVGPQACVVQAAARLRVAITLEHLRQPAELQRERGLQRAPVAVSPIWGNT